MRRSLVLVAILLAGSAELKAQGKGIRFWNLTTATVSSFQLSPATKDAWGPNLTLNDKDKEVDHDERLRITGIEPGRYDAKIGYPNGRVCFARGIDIKADAVFTVEDKDLKDCTGSQTK
jgi:hypothetical protein